MTGCIFQPIIELPNLSCIKGAAETMLEKLCALIADQFGVEPASVTVETAFEDDLGADSVDLVELSMALETEFGLDEMEEDAIAAIVTVGDLYQYMQDHLEL